MPGPVSNRCNNTLAIDKCFKGDSLNQDGTLHHSKYQCPELWHASGTQCQEVLLAYSCLKAMNKDLEQFTQGSFYSEMHSLCWPSLTEHKAQHALLFMARSWLQI